MKKKIIGSVIFSLAVAIIAVLVGVFVLSSETKVSGQQKSVGWRVWIKTSPCSGRFDWLTVARENPTGGGNTFVPYETVIFGRECTKPAPNGCTFAKAEAVRDSLRPHGQFFEYCCRDYSVWKNTQTGKMSVVQGRFGTAGFGWEKVSTRPLCCEEAEAEAGIPGACSSPNLGGYNRQGGGSGWGAFEEGSINQGDATIVTYFRGTNPEKCQADCDKNPKCEAFTFIKAGSYNANDPPMCYLLSEPKKITPSNCCVSAIKNKGGETGQKDTSSSQRGTIPQKKDACSCRKTCTACEGLSPSLFCDVVEGVGAKADACRACLKSCQ